MSPRLRAYARIAAGAVSLAAALFAQQAPAGASTVAPAHAKVGPAPKALRSGHPLVEAFAPKTMTSSAWTHSDDPPGGCPGSPSAVSVNARGYAELTTTGAKDNCTWIESPRALPTRPGYVVEADVYFSNFKDWPGFWLTGAAWPAQGELGAAEPNFGVNYVSWHQASCDATASDSEWSTNPWAYGCKTTVKATGKNIGPGWHVVDVAWTSSGVQVYYDGALYVAIKEHVTNGKTADPLHVVISEGSCQVGGSSQCVPGGLGTPGNIQVKYLRVFS